MLVDPGLETQQTRIIKYDIMYRNVLRFRGLLRTCILLLLQTFPVQEHISLLYRQCLHSQ